MKFNKSIIVGSRVINEDSPSFIIAEAGVNHNGNMELAKRMIDMATELGVDAIKFQAFKTKELILESVEKAEYQKETTGNQETQYEMLQKLEVTKDQFRDLKKHADKKNIQFLVTPFDEKSLEELEELEIDAYKISSTDLTNLPFLEKIAKTNKPIILSTGMSYLSEIEAALEEINKYNKQVVILQCTANYPVPENEVNLEVINTLRERFNILVGFSDHTAGIGASPYAAALGAKVIEKHYTLDKELEGPDQRASLDPVEFKSMVAEIRRVEKYMGNKIKAPQLSEIGTRKSLQKSFVAQRKIAKDELFSKNNIVAKRSGGVGISPLYSHQVIGKKSPGIFEVNEIITLD